MEGGAGAGAVGGAVGGGGGMDWDDRLSWEDSERFDEDSLCSWMSEPESICQNWRGWSGRAAPHSLQTAGCSYTGGICGSSRRPGHSYDPSTCSGGISTLKSLAARTLVKSKSFEEMEHCYRESQKNIPLFPAEIQKIVFRYCFPESEEDIRLYSCLANGSADEFQKGDNLYKARAVKDLIQIGFHLSANVDTSGAAAAAGTGNSRSTHATQVATATVPQPSTTVITDHEVFSVALTVDRCRITSCVCSCDPGTSWCCHVVAVCLHRMGEVNSVEFRVPVSESLNQLKEDQLRKFAQYLIQELPRQILPTAQRLLDVLNDPTSEENQRNGAPDPTAGGPQDDPASWCLDDQTLHENIKKILIKFCVPSPTVFSDVNYLSSSVPPVTNEWMVLLRPLRGREPEGLWNLLSIVREMYRRRDDNATELLHIITLECLSYNQVMVWWYQTKLSQSGTRAVSGSGWSGSKCNSGSNQYSCSSLCDEIVNLWRLACLNPRLSPEDREEFRRKLVDYHVKAVDKVWKLQQGNPSSAALGAPQGGAAGGVSGKLSDSAKFDLDSFPGFRSAVIASLSDWNDYYIEGVTYRPAPSFPSSCSELSVTCSSQDGRDALSPRAQSSCSPSLPVLREKNFSRRTKAPFPTSDSGNELSVGVRGSGSMTEIGSGVSPRTSTPSPDKQPSTSAERFRPSPSFVVSKSSKHGKNHTSSDDQSQAAASSRDCRNQPAASEALDEVSLLYMPPPQPDALNAHEENRRWREARMEHIPRDVFNDPSKESEDALLNLSRESDRLEVLFSRCEALHTYGYTVESCKLAVKLGKQLEKSPPDLMQEMPQPLRVQSSVTPIKSGRKGKKRVCEEFIPHPKAVEISRLATGTLDKAIFLFDVLLKESNLHRMAFEIGIFALEIPRQPAATKFLEVKMNQQEAEIVSSLKGIALGPSELDVLRQRAEQLRSGVYALKSPVLPFSLANYIFECLCLLPNRNLSPGDEELGFEAALAALGFTSTVSEAEHPLLCEGIRRQRQDMAIALLVKYKDNPERVAMIMDRLLDSDMHQMYRQSRSNAAYYLKNGGISPHLLSTHPHPPPLPPKASLIARSYSAISDASGGFDELIANIDAETGGQDEQEVAQLSALVEGLGVQAREDAESGNASRDPSPKQPGSDGASDSSSSGISRGRPQFQVGVQSQAPSAAESSSSHPASANASAAASPPPQPVSVAPKTVEVSSKAYFMKRSSSKRYMAPCIPNQASEAHAHSMTELAKRLLSEAGATQSTAIFTTHSTGHTNQQHGNGPHRALHLCAFQIGLYALGLHNKVTPNWLSRTYSSHVSWISGQAMEIGRTAIRILIDTWENHLTPTEVANLADKASQGREPGMVGGAAELSLSVLPFAHALNPAEIQRALAQCREQNTPMLEKACVAVEHAAKAAAGGVYPEVLFTVARHWHDLYKERCGEDGRQDNPNCRMPPQQMQPLMMAQALACPAQDQQNRVNPQMPPLSSTAQGMHHMAGMNPMTGGQVFGAPHQFAGPYPGGPFAPPNAAATANIFQPGTMAALQQMAMSQPQHFFNGGLGTNPNFNPMVSCATGMYPGIMNHNNMAGANPGAMTPLRYFAVPGGGAQGQMPQMNPMNPSAMGYYFPPQSNPANRTVHMSQSAPNLVHQQRHHHHHSPHNNPQQQHHHTHPPNPLDHQRDNVSRCLYSAYRVGMFAIQTLGRRIHDERSYQKYTQNPPYGDNVKWLFTVSKLLGLVYVEKFCLACAESVVSPFLLWTMVSEAAPLFGPSAPGASNSSNPLIRPVGLISGPGGITHLRFVGKPTNCVDCLVMKCVDMFKLAATQKLSHPKFVSSDLEEIKSLVAAAKTVYLTIYGADSSQFNQFIQILRKQKASKNKETWAHIMSVVNNEPC